MTIVIFYLTSSDAQPAFESGKAAAMKSKLQKHAEELALVQDPSSSDEPVWRRPGYEGIVALNVLENRIGQALRQARESSGLLHADVATMLGLHPQVYGRYERGESRLNVSRLIQLSELLDFSPLDVVWAAAPYRFGSSHEASGRRRKLIKDMETLPDDVVTPLVSLIDAMMHVKLATSK